MQEITFYINDIKCSCPENYTWDDLITNYTTQNNYTVLENNTIIYNLLCSEETLYISCDAYKVYLYDYNYNFIISENLSEKILENANYIFTYGDTISYLNTTTTTTESPTTTTTTAISTTTTTVNPNKTIYVLDKESYEDFENSVHTINWLIDGSVVKTKTSISGVRFVNPDIPTKEFFNKVEPYWSYDINGKTKVKTSYVTVGNEDINIYAYYTEDPVWTLNYYDTYLNNDLIYTITKHEDELISNDTIFTKYHANNDYFDISWSPTVLYTPSSNSDGIIRNDAVDYTNKIINFTTNYSIIPEELENNGEYYLYSEDENKFLNLRDNKLSLENIGLIFKFTENVLDSTKYNITCISDNITMLDCEINEQFISNFYLDELAGYTISNLDGIDNNIVWKLLNEDEYNAIITSKFYKLSGNNIIDNLDENYEDEKYFIHEDLTTKVRNFISNNYTSTLSNVNAGLYKISLQGNCEYYTGPTYILSNILLNINDEKYQIIPGYVNIIYAYIKLNDGDSLKISLDNINNTSDFKINKIAVDYYTDTIDVNYATELLNNTWKILINSETMSKIRTESIKTNLHDYYSALQYDISSNDISYYNYNKLYIYYNLAINCEAAYNNAEAILPKMKSFINDNSFKYNFYTTEALNTYYYDIQTAYDNNELDEETALSLLDPNLNTWIYDERLMTLLNSCSDTKFGVSDELKTISASEFINKGFIYCDVEGQDLPTSKTFVLTVAENLKESIYKIKFDIKLHISGNITNINNSDITIKVSNYSAELDLLNEYNICSDMKSINYNSSTKFYSLQDFTIYANTHTTTTKLTDYTSTNRFTNMINSVTSLSNLTVEIKLNNPKNIDLIYLSNLRYEEVSVELMTYENLLNIDSKITCLISNPSVNSGFFIPINNLAKIPYYSSTITKSSNSYNIELNCYDSIQAALGTLTKNADDTFSLTSYDDSDSGNYYLAYNVDNENNKEFATIRGVTSSKSIEKLKFNIYQFDDLSTQEELDITLSNPGWQSGDAVLIVNSNDKYLRANGVWNNLLTFDDSKNTSLYCWYIYKIDNL